MQSAVRMALAMIAEDTEASASVLVFEDRLQQIADDVVGHARAGHLVVTPTDVTDSPATGVAAPLLALYCEPSLDTARAILGSWPCGNTPDIALTSTVVHPHTIFASADWGGMNVTQNRDGELRVIARAAAVAHAAYGEDGHPVREGWDTRLVLQVLDRLTAPTPQTFATKCETARVLHAAGQDLWRALRAAPHAQDTPRPLHQALHTDGEYSWSLLCRTWLAAWAWLGVGARGYCGGGDGSSHVRVSVPAHFTAAVRHYTETSLLWHEPGPSTQRSLQRLLTDALVADVIAPGEKYAYADARSAPVKAIWTSFAPLTLTRGHVVRSLVGICHRAVGGDLSDSHMDTHTDVSSGIRMDAETVQDALLYTYISRWAANNNRSTFMSDFFCDARDTHAPCQLHNPYPVMTRLGTGWAVTVFGEDGRPLCLESTTGRLVDAVVLWALLMAEDGAVVPRPGVADGILSALGLDVDALLDWEPMSVEEEEADLFTVTLEHRPIRRHHDEVADVVQWLFEAGMHSPRLTARLFELHVAAVTGLGRHIGNRGEVTLARLASVVVSYVNKYTLSLNQIALLAGITQALVGPAFGNDEDGAAAYRAEFYAGNSQVVTDVMGGWPRRHGKTSISGAGIAMALVAIPKYVKSCYVRTGKIQL